VLGELADDSETQFAGGKSGGCARKAVEPSSPGPQHVTEAVTEDGLIVLDRAAGVSRGHSRPIRSKSRVLRSRK